MKEELIRVKLLLDQCQYHRRSEQEKMQKLQQRIRSYEQVSPAAMSSPIDQSVHDQFVSMEIFQNIKIDPPKSQVQSHVQLIDKISKLQVSSLLRLE